MDRPQATAINIFMRDNPDMISFHSYDSLERTAERVGSLKPYGRPILRTEYLARASGSMFESHLPYFKANRIGAWNWCLVAGKIQTQYPWSSWKQKFTAEPEVWHHDLPRPDGPPSSEGDSQAPSSNPQPQGTMKILLSLPRAAARPLPAQGDLDNGIWVGYPTWCRAEGDGSPVGGWRHRFKNDTLNAESLHHGIP